MHMGASQCLILSGCGERDVAEGLSQTLAPWATPSGWYPEARSYSRCRPLGCKFVTHLGNTYFIIVKSPRCFGGSSQPIWCRERAEFRTGWVHLVIRFRSYLANALPDSTASLKPCHPVVREPSAQGSYVQGWGSRCPANAKI